MYIFPVRPDHTMCILATGIPNHIRWCSCIFIFQMGSYTLFQTVAWICWEGPGSVVKNGRRNDTCEVRVAFVKWDSEEGLDAVSRLCAAVSLLVGEQDIITRCPYVIWVYYYYMAYYTMFVLLLYLYTQPCMIQRAISFSSPYFRQVPLVVALPPGRTTYAWFGQMQNPIRLP